MTKQVQYFFQDKYLGGLQKMKAKKIPVEYCHRCGGRLDSLYYKLNAVTTIPYDKANYFLCKDCYKEFCKFIRNTGPFEFELPKEA